MQWELKGTLTRQKFSVSNYANVANLKFFTYASNQNAQIQDNTFVNSASGRSIIMLLPRLRLVLESYHQYGQDQGRNYTKSIVKLLRNTKDTRRLYAFFRSNVMKRMLSLISIYMKTMERLIRETKSLLRSIMMFKDTYTTLSCSNSQTWRRLGSILTEISIMEST